MVKISVAKEVSTQPLTAIGTFVMAILTIFTFIKPELFSITVQSTTYNVVGIPTTVSSLVNVGFFASLVLLVVLIIYFLRKKFKARKK